MLILTLAASMLGPSSFSPDITNPFLPMPVGTTFLYEGQSDGESMSNSVVITADTKLINGVTTREVLDDVYVNGHLEERTKDWYAQDSLGNVWYFGEDTAELDVNGNVISTEGTWTAGVGGAQAGIIMEAHPHKGDFYHQELLTGVAEDVATVLTTSLNKKIRVPYGTFACCLVTEEFTPLEPKVYEDKYYARNVGFIYSTMKQGGKETLALVSITNNNLKP